MIGSKTYWAIRGSFSNRVPDDSWCLRHVFRPLSQAAAVPFVLLGWSANAVTILGGLVGAVAVLCYSQPTLWTAGGGLFLVYVVLDLADGNVARYRNSASYYGKFLDGWADGIVQALLFIGMGIGLGTAAGALPLGIATGCLLLVGYLTVTRLSFFQRWLLSEQLLAAGGEPCAEGSRNPLSQRTAAISSTVYRRLHSVSLDSLYIGISVAAVWDASRPTIFLILCVLFSLESILLVWNSLRTARQTLNYRRMSKNAVPAERPAERELQVTVS